MRTVPSIILASLAYTAAAAAADTANATTCSASSWRPPAEIRTVNVQTLLRNIPMSEKWADLPAATQAQLEQAAAERLASFRARWAEGALAKKEYILLGCPTREMTVAIDDFYRKTYDTVVPPHFSLASVKNPAFHRALVRNYLGSLASARAYITYPLGKLPNRDWDGISPFDSTNLPDQQSYDDIRAYNASLAAELRNIPDASLDMLERTLMQRVLYDARSNAAGGSSFGDADMETACHIVSMDYAVLAGYQLDGKRPRMFADDEAVVRETNAAYLNNMKLKWLDVGTFNAAVNFCDISGPHKLTASLIGDPATNDVAKALILFKNWWVERTAASRDAHNKCTIYSPADRSRIWEAFSGASLFNNDNSLAMETYKSLLNDYIDKSRSRYREIARRAVTLVFPDGATLAPGQRRQVMAAIDTETAFGSFPEKIKLAIDAAQGTTNGPAAAQWNNAIAKYVERIGGNYPPGAAVRPDEKKQLEDMFAEVKTWVAREHQGYGIDIASLYPAITFRIDTQSGVPDTVPPGIITFGVATRRSKMEYYSWMIHELRHAVWMAQVSTSTDKSKAVNDEGLAVEGSGVAVESLLLEPFTKSVLKNDTAYTLYTLDFGIRDARYAGTTDATLQRYFRADCSAPSAPNTIDFARDIAISYGLTGPLADTAAMRAHAGTQYLQYIAGGLHVLDAIAYLQNEIDATMRHRIDPYLLFACGLNNPRRDAAYVTALGNCIRNQHVQ